MTDKKTDLSRRSLLAATAAAAAVAACSPREVETKQAGRNWDVNVDVLIAGSGVAGTSAALEARRAGLDVLVIEKFQALGGSSGMSGGVCYMGGGTALQKALGFDDTVEAMYDYIVAAGAPHPQLEKIELYCEGAVEQFDWLVANGVYYKQQYSGAKGVPMDDSSLYFSGSEPNYPYSDIARPAPRGHMPSARMDLGGRELMKALHAQAKKEGVRFATLVSGERLVIESDGRVSGMRVDWQGSSKIIGARYGVLLACGGFIHNREMTKTYAPQLHECSAPWGNAGDLGMGIQMGIGAGGTTVRMDQGFAIMPLYQPDYVLAGIVVNRQAQRFIAEDIYHAFLGNEIAFHQGGQAYLVTDANSSYKHEDYRVRPMAEAASIASLEAVAGLPAGALLNTVDYYNEHAAAGHDPLYRKHSDYLRPLAKPPFKLWDLAVDKSFFAAHTFGGLHTNVDAQVLDAWGEAVPGLYAAGRTSWGLPSAPYIASGISVGDGCCFGRRAGKHMATHGGGA